MRRHPLYRVNSGGVGFRAMKEPTAEQKLVEALRWARERVEDGMATETEFWAYEALLEAARWFAADDYGDIDHDCRECFQVNPSKVDPLSFAGHKPNCTMGRFATAAKALGL